jgi:acetylornithine deacetylase/succinyl-diaminopimelate desuccinylase-like protein
MTAEPLSDEALLARLVAFDTTSHKSNREIADFISDYLDRPGVRITRHPTADGAKLNLIVAASEGRELRSEPAGQSSAEQE